MNDVVVVVDEEEDEDDVTGAVLCFNWFQLRGTRYSNQLQYCNYNSFVRP